MTLTTRNQIIVAAIGKKANETTVITRDRHADDGEAPTVEPGSMSLHGEAADGQGYPEHARCCDCGKERPEENLRRRRQRSLHL